MPASAPTAAATRTRRKRSASAGLKASSFRVSSITAPTTAVRWSPLTESRWARPGAAHRLGIGLGNADTGRRWRAPRRCRPRPRRRAARGCAPQAAGASRRSARARPCAEAGRDQGDVERAAGAADPLEPGGAGEIIGARHRHRRRRHQPGAQPDGGAGGERRGASLLVDIDPQPRRQAGAADRARPRSRNVRSAASAWTLSIRARELHQLLALEPRRRGALGLPPDQAAAQGGGKGEDRQRPSPPRRPRRRRRPSAKRQRRAARKAIQPGRSGSQNQAAMPSISPTGSQSGSWLCSASNRRSSPRKIPKIANGRRARPGERRPLRLPAGRSRCRQRVPAFTGIIPMLGALA